MLTLRKGSTNPIILTINYNFDSPRNKCPRSNLQTSFLMHPTEKWQQIQSTFAIPVQYWQYLPVQQLTGMWGPE